MPQDDPLLFKTVRDISGGVNTRQQATVIQENQMSVLYNVDIGVAGESSKRRGSILIANDIGDVTSQALCNYERQGYTDNLVMYNDKELYAWEGAGNWTTVTASAFTASATTVSILACKESGLTPDDIIIVQNRTESKRFHKDSGGTWAVDVLTDDNNSIPKTDVMAWYSNRVWTLKSDLLSYSDAYPSAYSSAFDRTTNAYRIPVGPERGIAPIRDTGLIVMGNSEIWGLNPSVTPAATDKPEPLITDRGVVSKRGWSVIGDDLHFFSQDGHRSLKRTIQDKLQLGVTYPISYPLKDEFDNIDWAYISQLTMEYFDNKLFIGVPTGASSYDTWVYYPASQSYMVIQGWSPACWAKYKVNGEEGLYYAKRGDGKAYQAWTGYTDEGTTTSNGTAINYQEEGREENLGQPLIKKNAGEVEIKALSTGDYDIAVSISLDGSSYQSLGVINLNADAQTLPQTLPFTLTDLDIAVKKFHLDPYGPWKTLKIKLVHNANNSTDEIKIYERSVMAYKEEYESE